MFQVARRDPESDALGAAAEVVDDVPDPAVAIVDHPITVPWQLPRTRPRAGLPLLGPAFVAAIAYVDPGNFASNVQAGSRFGYLLLWVVVAANAMAMLVQYLSAKLGVATGQNLAELCRDHLQRSVTWVLWVQAEIIAMATDIAEVIGAAIALNLLFGVPLLVGGLLTTVATFAILALQSRGLRRFELAIAAFLIAVFLAFLYDTLRVRPDAGGAARGLIPSVGHNGAILLATAIVGATIMPHVIYLHSAMTQARVTKEHDAQQRRRILDIQRIDVVSAMTVASVVNVAILAVSAALFYRPGQPVVDTIPEAYAGISSQVGMHAALAFALALLASGLAASSVGTYAGQVVMLGFIRRTLPLKLRRLVTIAPALLILGLGIDPTETLVVSQVVLSFGIPFALIPLVSFTRRRDIMGGLVNRHRTTLAAGAVSALVIAMNAVLLIQTL